MFRPGRNRFWIAAEAEVHYKGCSQDRPFAAFAGFPFTNPKHTENDPRLNQANPNTSNT